MGKAEIQNLELEIQGLKLAIVVSRYNLEICDKLLAGAMRQLQASHVTAENYQIYRVPGAFELPWAAKGLAATGKFDALVCLGVVIRGDTSHFDYVCQGATQGIMQAMLDTGVPIAFGVLTTENETQAQDRSRDDENNKGAEAVRTALEMAVFRKKFLSR